MAKYDLSGVLSQAEEAQKSSSGEGSGGSGYRVLYPFYKGNMYLRILFNPAAGVVFRTIRRHRINDERCLCLEQYGQECPVCKTIDNIINLSGSDDKFWSLKSQFRAICFAQYVRSDFEWDKDDNEPNPGDVVIFMAPWTIYKQCSEIFTNAGENLDQIVAVNQGKLVIINKKGSGLNTTYSASIDAFSSYKSADSDEEFDKLLESLPDLNEQIIPSTPTDEDMEQINKIVKYLNKEYIGANVASNVTDTPKAAVDKKEGSSSDGESSGSTEPGNQEIPPDAPECYGNEGHDEDKCLMCPAQLTCINYTKMKKGS